MLLLRMLRASHMASWDSDDDPDWVGEHDGPGDLIAHFVPEKNSLSVYEVTEPQVPRVCAALAANRLNVQHVHYSVVDRALIEAHGFALKAEEGSCPDAEVNSWHRDLVALSVRKLPELALLFRARGTRKRLLHKEVGKLINFGITEGQIDRSVLNPALLKDLGKPIYVP